MDAHTQGQVDYWAAARQLGLDPQRPTGQEARCRCPQGCDDGHRPQDFGSSLNINTGHLVCYRCGGYHLDNLTRGELPQREAPPRPEPAREAVDIVQAWRTLSGLRADHMPRVRAYALGRRWPDELAKAVASHPDVAWAPERPVGSRHADRLRAHAWARSPSEPEDAPPRPLLVALRDAEGAVVSVMRRAVDRAASPKSKRASKSLCPVAGLALLGDLTRLPRLEGPLLVVEGETDYLAADTLCAMGALPCGGAVGTPSRSGLLGLARELVSRLPAGTRVICVPDLGDRGQQQQTWDAGERDMERACAELVRAGHHATLLRLPTDQAGKADFCQVLEERGLDELVRLIEAHLEEGGGEPPPGPPGGDGGGGGGDGQYCVPLTDVGNRQRFLQRHGEDVRFCPGLGGWLVWGPEGWDARVESNRAQELAIETAHSIREEARTYTGELRASIERHARRSESSGAISAMMRLASSHPGIQVQIEELDAEPYLLAVANGVLDLRTGQLRGARRTDLLTRRCPTPYDPTATCPTFERFIMDVFGGDAALVEYVQRVVGYTLTGVTDEQIFLFLYGEGRNGKGTLTELLTDLLSNRRDRSRGYASAASFDTFLAGKGGPREDLAALRGARLVTASEPNAGVRLDEGFIKSITGGDTVSVRHLYGRHFNFRPEFTLWLSGNHLPEVRDGGHGLWRRLKALPFGVRFVDEADRLKGLEGPPVDKQLPWKLRAELPGVLAWAVRGCLWWQEEGLCEPEAVTAATQQYRESQDNVARFLDQEAVLHPEAKVRKSALYQAYRDWTQVVGIKPGQVKSDEDFTALLAARGLQSRKSSGGYYFFFGVGLPAAPDPQGGMYSE